MNVHHVIKAGKKLSWSDLENNFTLGGGGGGGGVGGSPTFVLNQTDNVMCIDKMKECLLT